jgi:hypothetical protein
MKRPRARQELETLASALLALPPADFVEVFGLVSDAVGGDDGPWSIGGGSPYARLVLAIAYIDAEVTETGALRDAQCLVELLAYPTDEGRAALLPGGQRGPSAGFWENGACDQCGAELTSQ